MYAELYDRADDDYPEPPPLADPPMSLFEWLVMGFTVLLVVAIGSAMVYRALEGRW